MSEVISFRLSNKNPRESQALRVLHRFREEGQSIRYIITEALLKLDDQQTKELEPAYWVEVSDKLRYLSTMIEQLGLEHPLDPISEITDSPEPMLSSCFVASVIKTIKPGIGLG